MYIYIYIEIYIYRYIDRYIVYIVFTYLHNCDFHHKNIHFTNEYILEIITLQLNLKHFHLSWWI